MLLVGIHLRMSNLSSAATGRNQQSVQHRTNIHPLVAHTVERVVCVLSL
jgi:hypothetical protein